ncbi:hypothetical protein [Sphingomonas sp. LHG3406-1]|uniref:hypothetical protein n=1 Tax=Sphingomonas sp. LHG3406-1 TaxID=2804617 RepID=UPI002601CDFE|nr:hypothetical protein [Sphingomonas sp. LHG3406-1]
MQTYRSSPLLMLAMLSGFGASAGGAAPERRPASSPPTQCGVMPADFRIIDRAAVEGPRNLIQASSDGAIRWNGAALNGMHGPRPFLDTFLDMVVRMEPVPATILRIDETAPCETIELAREMMRKHLSCSPARACLQEASPN